MYDKEPNDWIKQRKEKQDADAQAILELRLRNTDRALRKRRKKERRQNRLKSWGIVVGILASLVSIAGVLYGILFN